MGSTREKGFVKWFNSKKGYGFVCTDDEPEHDIFVHFSYINMEGYKALNKDQRVEFDKTETDRGIQAHNVVPVD